MGVLRTLVIGVLLACLGCTAPLPPPTAPVSLTLDPVMTNRRLTITGTTNLPDGAILMYEARHENWRLAGEPVWLRAGQTAVKDGTYADRLNVSRWPEGTIEVWVAFQAVLLEGTQPPDVTARYGPMGEGLTGDDVTRDGPMRRIERTVSLAP